MATETKTLPHPIDAAEASGVKTKPERFLAYLGLAGDANPANWWSYCGTEKGDDAATQFTKHNPTLHLPKPWDNPQLSAKEDWQEGKNLSDDAKDKIQRLTDERQYKYMCICTQTYDEIAYTAHKTLPVALAIGCHCVTKVNRAAGSKAHRKRCVTCKEPYPGKYDDCKACRGFKLAAESRDIEEKVRAHQVELMAIQARQALAMAEQIALEGKAMKQKAAMEAYLHPTVSQPTMTQPPPLQLGVDLISAMHELSMIAGSHWWATLPS